MDELATESQPSTVSSIVTSGVLKHAIAAAERERNVSPRHLPLLRRLGKLYRQSGQLEQAAKIFDLISEIDPTDREAAYLQNLLSGRASIPKSNKFPPSFLLSRHHLAEEAYRNLVASLAPLAVTMKAHKMHGKTARWDYVGSLGSAGTWFRQHIVENLSQWCHTLGIPLFPPEIRGVSFTRYADGQFYPLHNDGKSPQGNLVEVIYFLDFSVGEFQGGELLILDDNDQRISGWTSIPPTPNTMVVFPSTHWHEIAPVRCASPDRMAGRFMLAAYVKRAG